MSQEAIAASDSVKHVGGLTAQQIAHIWAERTAPRMSDARTKAHASSNQQRLRQDLRQSNRSHKHRKAFVRITEWQALSHIEKEARNKGQRVATFE